MDPVIRPENGLLLIALQSAEDSFVTLDPALHAVSIVDGSMQRGAPFTTEQSNENNGSFVAAAPLVIGQEVKFSWRARLRGAGPGITYTGSVKAPLHAALSCCGWRGFFQAAVAAAALTAGSATSGTLGTGYTGTAQLYLGMPLILSVGPGAGHMPFVTNYTSGKVATLSDTFSPALDNTTLAAIPAHWTYAGTTPADAAARATDHPYATVGWYEDGNLYQWGNVRGVVDLEGQSTRPGEAAFSMSGVYIGATTPGMPTNAVVASHTAPLLVKGAGTPPAVLINRLRMPISRWSLRNGGELEGVEDPNTQYGFGASQIVGRTPVFECDPLSTLATTRDIQNEIAAASQYPIALRAGTVAGNRWGLVIPQAQPVQGDPGMRGKKRVDQARYQATSIGRDAQARDSDRFLIFS